MSAAQNLSKGLFVLECKDIFIRYVIVDKDVRDLLMEWLRDPQRYVDTTTFSGVNFQQLNNLSNELYECDTHGFIRAFASLDTYTMAWFHDVMTKLKTSLKKCTCQC